MALVANSLNFTWSRWNLLSGYDKLIMQYRERLPGAPEVNHQASLTVFIYSTNVIQKYVGLLGRTVVICCTKTFHQKVKLIIKRNSFNPLIPL
jgi:hypothetical protein